MRVFKATYKDRGGRKRESDKWYVEVVDHDERPRRLPAFSDKQQSEALGRKVEKLVECKQNRDTPGRELSAWLETLPRRICEKLAAWGIIEGRTVAASKPLADHVKDFKTALIAKGSSEQHALHPYGARRAERRPDGPNAASATGDGNGRPKLLGGLLGGFGRKTARFGARRCSERAAGVE